MVNFIIWYRILLRNLNQSQCKDLALFVKMLRSINLQFYIYIDGEETAAAKLPVYTLKLSSNVRNIVNIKRNLIIGIGKFC